MGKKIDWGGGVNPTGTILTLMGKTAPEGYLACDGTVYNIEDYPGLADYFEQQFDTNNYFGGDGVTTFAVPDLRGEFLRGSGTNSHTNQGSGANVGVHQNSTSIPNGATDGSAKRYSMYTKTTAWSETVENIDSSVATSYVYRIAGTPETLSYGSGMATLRPTNTSVLYCIKY